MVFDSLRRALGGSEGDRALELQVELDRVQTALFQRADELDQKRATRLQALFPDGPVAGAGGGLHGTWPTNLGRFGAPLDHVLYRGPFSVIQHAVGPRFGSDHRPLFTVLGG